MNRKQKQKQKKKEAIACELWQTNHKKTVELAKKNDSTNFTLAVKKSGGVDKLAKLHSKARLTILPKQPKKISKVGMVKDTLPFESKANGILTVNRLSKSDGYKIGLDTLGFCYIFGKWRKLEK